MPQNVAANLYAHGSKKYAATTVLSSSEGRGWSGVAAELREHPPCEFPALVPQHNEIIVAIRGRADGWVHRTGAGEQQDTRTIDGTIWLCPAGVGEKDVRISDPLPEILHIYLAPEHFNALAAEHGISPARAHSIRYTAGFQDEIIRQIGLSFVSELRSETSAGRMFVEAAALTLAARLVHSYADSGSVTERRSRVHRLDEIRLRRVLDYIANHLEQQMTVVELAGVACLSPFHFTRMFRATMGLPPHRYVSERRLDHAKALLASGDRSLADIALTSCFSSQASFSRAFRRVVGVTPGEYRQSIRAPGLASFSKNGHKFSKRG